MLARVLKRKTSRECIDPKEFLEAEFRNAAGDYDLCLSAYEIDVSDLVRCCAEHSAAIPLNPRAETSAIDLSNPEGKVVGTPGNGTFQFLDETHREILLVDVDELTELSRRAIDPERSPRHQIKKADLLKYATSRISTSDPEWLALRSHPQVKKLKKWLKGL